VTLFNKHPAKVVADMTRSTRNRNFH